MASLIVKRCVEYCVIVTSVSNRLSPSVSSSPGFNSPPGLQQNIINNNNQNSINNNKNIDILVSEFLHTKSFKKLM